MAIHTNMTPKQKVRRNKVNADRAVAEAFKKKNIYPEMIINGTILDQPYQVHKLEKVEDLTSSSPPGTAQEIESQIGDYGHIEK